jgi:hypothetical protein
MLHSSCPASDAYIMLVSHVLLNMCTYSSYMKVMSEHGLGSGSESM